MKLSTYSYRFSAPHPPSADPPLLPELAENSDTGEMDEPHFFPMIAQQYRSPSPSTSDDEIDNTDSSIGALDGNLVPPQRTRRAGGGPKGLGREEPRTNQDNLVGLEIGSERLPTGRGNQPSPSRRWKGQQYPSMEPELETTNPELEEPTTPIKAPRDGATLITPRRKITKSRKSKRLSVIHEVVADEEVSERKTRWRDYKGLVKRIPGLSRYEILRLRAEKMVPRRVHASPQRVKKGMT